MKSRSLSKRRMRSLRRHCSSKNHRRALRSRSLRTRKMHRKLCKGVRRKTARKRNRHTKKCPKGKHRRLHGQRRMAAADESPVTVVFQRNATATQSAAAPSADAVTEAEMELRTTQAD